MCFIMFYYSYLLAVSLIYDAHFPASKEDNRIRLYLYGDLPLATEHYGSVCRLIEGRPVSLSRNNDIH